MADTVLDTDVAGMNSVPVYCMCIYLHFIIRHSYIRFITSNTFIHLVVHSEVEKCVSIKLVTFDQSINGVRGIADL